MNLKILRNCSVQSFKAACQPIAEGLSFNCKAHLVAPTSPCTHAAAFIPQHTEHRTWKRCCKRSPLQMSQNARVRGNPNLYVPEKKGTEGKIWLQVQVSAGVFRWQTALKLCSSLVQQTFLCRNKHIPKSPMAWPGPCPHPGQESNLG